MDSRDALDLARLMKADGFLDATIADVLNVPKSTVWRMLNDSTNEQLVVEWVDELRANLSVLISVIDAYNGHPNDRRQENLRRIIENLEESLIAELGPDARSPQLIYSRMLRATKTAPWDDGSENYSDLVQNENEIEGNHLGQLEIETTHESDRLADVINLSDDILPVPETLTGNTGQFTDDHRAQNQDHRKIYAQPPIPTLVVEGKMWSDLQFEDSSARIAPADTREDPWEFWARSNKDVKRSFEMLYSEEFDSPATSEDEIRNAIYMIRRSIDSEVYGFIFGDVDENSPIGSIKNASRLFSKTLTESGFGIFKLLTNARYANIPSTRITRDEYLERFGEIDLFKSVHSPSNRLEKILEIQGHMERAWTVLRNRDGMSEDELDLALRLASNQMENTLNP